jgi:hypothetical protein
LIRRVLRRIVKGIEVLQPWFRIRVLEQYLRQEAISWKYFSSGDRIVKLIGSYRTLANHRTKIMFRVRWVEKHLEAHGT